MDELEQVPFGDLEFAENPEPRVPCVLLLDTSSSMTGAKIQHLNEGLQTFAQELQSDDMASKRAEVAVITFGPVSEIQGFITADSFFPMTLTAQSDTPMGAAIKMSIDLVEQRKAKYRAEGIAYYRPWIFLITDGAPTDDVTAARAAVREGEASNAFAFFAVGVDGADMQNLQSLSVRDALSLRGMSFREMFVWLSKSLRFVSRSQMGDEVPLDNPTAPDGWASIA
jgi:uncharacterized protein YegL